MAHYIITNRGLSKYSPDQPRDDHGRWSDEGGGGQQHISPEAILAETDKLKARWADINNSLLQNIDHPDAAQVQDAMDQMKQLCKEIYALQAMASPPPKGVRDIVIVGAGPGGLAAGIMGGTDGLNTLVVDANAKAGGQAKYSSRIENYPGFPIGASGEQLASNFMDQAQRVGAETRMGVRVTGLGYNEQTGIKTLTLSDGTTVDARAVILAGGAEFPTVSFPGSNSKSVVIGDGKALTALGKDGDVIVAGGSNGAAQAALGAATAASHVTVLSRSPIAKGMSDYQVQALKANSKISVIEGDSIDSLKTDADGNAVSLKTANGKTLPVKALGVFYGSKTDINWLPKSIKTAEGKVVANGDLETSMPGVFVVGDMRHGAIGRIGAAVGDGQMAERNAFGYFNRMPKAPAAPKPDDDKKAMKATAAQQSAWNSLIDKVFALDSKYPWLGQTIDPEVEDAPKPRKYSEDQPRDERGRWMDGGGAVDSHSPADFATRLSQPDAGFTVSAVTGHEPTGAGHYAVSIYPELSQVAALQFVTPAALYKYMKDNEAVLSRPDHYMGGWHDPVTGKIWLDVSVVVNSPEAAESLAKAHNQLAYFDFGAGKSVRVEGTDGGQGKSVASGYQQAGHDTGTAGAHNPDDVLAADRAIRHTGGAGRTARSVRFGRKEARRQLLADALLFTNAGDPLAAKLARSYYSEDEDFLPDASKAAGRQEPDLARALVRAWKGCQRSLDMNALSSAIASRHSLDVIHIWQQANVSERTKDALRPRLVKAFMAGVKVGQVPLERHGITVRQSTHISLTGMNQRAVDWAQQHAAQLVVQTDDDQKEMIRLLTAEAETGSYTVNDLALVLQSIVGLDDRRAQAVLNYQDRLSADGISGDDLASKVSAYADAQLRSRSMTIARTELMDATNSGQQALWNEAVSQGLIDSESMVKVWIVADDERLCDDCDAMDGETCDISDEFDGGDPPMHPNCRCTTGLTADKGREAPPFRKNES